MTIQNYITHFCQHCGIDSEQVVIDQTEADGVITVNITVPQEDSGLFIGFHGETLISLQRVLRVTFQEELAGKKLLLNVNEYREQREEKIREMARSAADRVLESGSPYRFTSLTPPERFVVHTLITESEEYQDLESYSEGEDPRRVLIIRKKNAS